MSAPSEGTTQSPSTPVGKAKSSRKGKIIGVWFALSIWLLILVFNPFRPFDEIWSLPRIFIITNGQLDLPNTVFWVIGATISASLIYFGIGSVQSSTYQTNIVQTPSEWIVRFIVGYVWSALHKEPSKQEDELFAEVSGRIPMIASLEGTVDVRKLMVTGVGDEKLSGESSRIERVLARVERLSRQMDVDGIIITPIDLEDGKKGWMRLDYQPKMTGVRKEEKTTAVSTRMLLDPHDVTDIGDVPPEVRRALGIPSKPVDGASKEKDPKQSGA